MIKSELLASHYIEKWQLGIIYILRCVTYCIENKIQKFDPLEAVKTFKGR